MRKMRIVLEAVFEIPSGVIIHEDAFEAEDVIFQPEITFDCVEIDPYIPENLLRFPNDIESLKEYLIFNKSVDCKISLEPTCED
jgi:hypothetical protein